METIASEDIPIGEDLTPPLPPLAAVLHNSDLSTHCAACFSPLPPQPFHPLTPTFSQIPQHDPDDTPTLLYCSPQCSSLDSSLHLSSAEVQILSLLQEIPSSERQLSADLRLSLRLLYIFGKLNLIPQVERDWRRMSGLDNNDKGLMFEENNHCPFQENKNIEGPDENLEKKEQPNEHIENRNQDDRILERIAGLMTNREELMFQENKNDHLQEDGNGEDPDEISGKCNVPDENVENCSENEVYLERIREGAKLMAMARMIYSGVDVNEVAPEECVVEEMVLCLVLTNAVEVQDSSGSYVGIAVYGTTFSWMNHSCSPNARYRFSTRPEHNDELRLRISSSAMENGSGNGNEMSIEGREAYGPVVIVRSIKAIKKGEEVTIAYMDVFRPKKLRQSELWMKYRFNCGCKRCSAEPASYVDFALQATYAVNLDCLVKISDHHPCKDEEIKILTDFFDNLIDGYLHSDDLEPCCEKLENLLTHGYFVEELGPMEAESHQILKLHPFHHISLNSYSTLASAYENRANDLLALDSGIDRHKLEAFNMHRTGAAYSLLLAGAAHHLFTFESSFMASVATSWKSAGESLLKFAKCSSWNLFLKSGPVNSELSFLLTPKCPECSLVDRFEANFISGQDQNVQLEEITRQFFNCIVTITSKVWRSLISECSYLKAIENPIDFSWLAPLDSYTISDFGARFAKTSKEKVLSEFEAKECTKQDRTNLILLSVHCLRYGAFLSSVCNGLHSQ
ncbi:protein SET DOMAIN GROUP 41 [Forsythia ovata]|uniref:Protein SET DOMAIN GROUP 41 n=2 Tax=Forsythia ovata TaxID=205694 RepID=A0ABD1RMD4_9LAMI